MTIIPQSERSAVPLTGEKVFNHPDMVRANEYVLGDYAPPTRDLCVFVPCAKTKPYHISPSHHNYDKVIFSVLRPEDVHIIAFGTCGVTPRELDSEYPFAHYDFVLGECDVLSVKQKFIELESLRLYRYLEKTRNNYKIRVAYCLGDFRKAMIQACDNTDVHVSIAPYEDTMERCRVLGRKFEYGSLSNPQYLADLKEVVVASSSSSAPERQVGPLKSAQCDLDWYML